MTTPNTKDIRQAALDYHAQAPAGKLATMATKPLVNPRDLALAYSPGVAAPCEEIVADPATAYRYTARGNLVAVMSNGTAVLGLGDIGALASKPVMEGKAVLFKKFAGIDCFDIEIDQKDPAKLVETIAALEPTFGAINLEDIKAPDCFYVERELRKRMKIPVFHDDQHGTAITVAAAMVSALAVTGKKIDEIKLVTSGAGAAALACLNLLVKLGLKRENTFVTDLAGVVYEGRAELMDEDKRQYARRTEARSLAEVICGADVFLGLSAGGVLKPAMVAEMAANPVIFALANPHPEIMPEDAHAVRSDVVIRLPEPGQQPAVLPVRVPRRAGLRRDDDHRRDGDRRGARDLRPGACRAERSRCGSLRRRAAGLRPGLPDPEALRSAPDDSGRISGSASGGRQRFAAPGATRRTTCRTSIRSSAAAPAWAPTRA
jgi:malate dehydrogenase (oxaloacetate-decarboxylating)(NADP+)